MRNILAYIWVLAPSVPLEKLTEEAENQEYLDAVERMEPEVEGLAEKLADQLNIELPALDDDM